MIRTCELYGMDGSRSKAGNFVETMLRLAERVLPLIELQRYGLYHMTSTGQCSWHECAAEVFAKVDADLQLPTAEVLARRRAARPIPYSTIAKCVPPASPSFAPGRKPWPTMCARAVRDCRSLPAERRNGFHNCGT